MIGRLSSPARAAALAALLALAGLPLAAPNLTNVRDCGSTSKVIDATVADCEEAPCRVERGSNVTVNIIFQASNLTESLRPEVVGVVSGFELPIAELDHEDGCDRLLKGACPLDDGDEAEYTASFLLDPLFPKIKGEVRWHLFDEFNATVVCISIDAEAV
ncbi:NPC intracellular cholesterol transporter 2 homolog a [Gryllus bimaculatus]|nr:NPC intracellular cholesterol transporter 2 homolog a [Gryllus bimaculatus]